MAWRKTDVEAERKSLVQDWLKGRYTVVQLARMYGVSERVAHKALKRFREGGYPALQDRSRARHTQVCTASEIVNALVESRRSHPHWGPRKLRSHLATERPEVEWPAVSTVGSILVRHGLVVERRRRRARAQRAGDALADPQRRVRRRCHHQERPHQRMLQVGLRGVLPRRAPGRRARRFRPA